MTDADKTWVALIVDRSGSMDTIRGEAQGAVEGFIKEQQEQPGEAYLTLVEFDHGYNVVHEGARFDMIPAAYKLLPRGMTALYDAMGRTIIELGERLAAMPEDERPGKVIVVTVTDGYENSSKEFTQPQVFDLVKQQQESYGWEFAYLGVGVDAMKEGPKVGIQTNMSVARSSAGMYAGGQSLNSMVSSYRKSGVASWQAPEDPDGSS